MQREGFLLTSEVFKSEILENKNRRKICRAVEASPGIHLRELQRMLDIAPTTLEYHLTYMARKKIIFGESDGHYKRYYARPLRDGDKKILALLGQEKMRNIVLTVLANKKAKNQLLADCLKLPRSTLSIYLKCLVENNVLAKEKVGYENIYTVRDENKIAKALMVYKLCVLH